MSQIEFSHDKANEVKKDLITLYAELLSNIIKETIYFMGNFEKHEYQQPISKIGLLGFDKGVRTNLDKLDYDIEKLIDSVLEEELIMFEDHLTEVYLDIFANELKLEEALENKWCGTNFRDVLKENTRKYTHKIKKEINSGLIRGDSKKQLKATITKLVNSFNSNIITILTTETTYMNSQALLDKGQDEGYTRVRVIEILDMKTCKLCASMHNAIIPIEYAEIGSNIPPFHPRCRGDIEYIK